jgi:hypothetical protein
MQELRTAYPHQRPLSLVALPAAAALSAHASQPTIGSLPTVIPLAPTVRGVALISKTQGKQVSEKLVDNTGGPPPGSGALFGLYATENSVFFVDDASNTFNLLH